MDTKYFGIGYPRLGCWLKINAQKLWSVQKSKKLNVCWLHICFIKSLLEKILRTWFFFFFLRYLTYLHTLDRILLHFSPICHFPDKVVEIEKIHMKSVKVYGTLPKNKCKDCYFNKYGYDGHQSYDRVIRHFC